MGHSIIMDDSSFPTLPEVVVVSSDDPIVVADCLVGYYLADSKSINLISSILRSCWSP